MTILEARFPCMQDSFDPVLAELNDTSIHHVLFLFFFLFFLSRIFHPWKLCLRWGGLPLHV